MASVLDLKGIAAAGAGLVLDASKFSTLDLKGIASSATGALGQIVFKNADSKSVLDLKAIAASGKGRVVFDFTA